MPLPAPTSALHSDHHTVTTIVPKSKLLLKLVPFLVSILEQSLALRSLAAPPAPNQTWPLPPLGYQNTPWGWLWVPQVPNCLPQEMGRYVGMWEQSPYHTHLSCPLVLLSTRN